MEVLTMSEATRPPDVERKSAGPCAGHDQLAAELYKALGMVEAMARTVLELIPAPIIASVDGDDEITDADVPTGDLADCPCNRRWSLDRAHHELMLLGWVDFLDFVAVHNWQDPETVQSLASMVDHAIRWQESAARASSRLKAVTALSEREQDGDQ